MITIDSCGWLEYYTAGPLAEEYGKYLKDLTQIVTPLVILYEVPSISFSLPNG
ncbi:type II toxin-antitoxin system VapC family toxin [Moorella sp. Hama-1]|uniref:type II toxin-antitoxin system VapC family toxin n=1 Tax=Moorella sp. Hama-1 TaxID=2138101 RepID=UPI00137A1CE2|nr:type II toxin-antitoxin system VapC family toxin [Moorella sp. Hama-1]BCV20759.1 hypothetical protein hamaS1_08280 [Moorella sp. Hama-1]